MFASEQTPLVLRLLEIVGQVLVEDPFRGDCFREAGLCAEPVELVINRDVKLHVHDLRVLLCLWHGSYPIKRSSISCFVSGTHFCFI